MPRLFQKYWYEDEAAIARAVLHNLRDDDIRPGGSIRKGQIVAGKCGFNVAEAAVRGFSGRTPKFKPNRQIEWQGFTLDCMALDGLPIGAAVKAGKSKLRHRHCVVAELTDPEQVATAKEIGLPILKSEDGRSLANLEVFTVPGRTPKFRRAKLLG